ncbi:MAG: hypothetical protein AAF629_34515 [Chloroflexota bacterium]
MSDDKLAVQQSTKSGGVVNSMLDFATNAINNADEAAAAAQVAKLRNKHPDLDDDALADILIKQKCYSTGAVGAITSGLSVIPGIGTVAALTFGAAADIGMTFKLQAELVLEMAALYGRDLSDVEKRTAVLTVTGIGAGSHHLAIKGGEKIAQRATEQLTAHAVAKAIPFVGVGVSAGANILTTYVIGQRAKSYFSLNETEMDDMGAQIRALSGVDEAKIAEWLSDTTQKSQQMVSNTAQDVAGGVIVAGQKSGELVLVAAGRTNQGVTALVGTVGGAASIAQRFAVDSGKKVGEIISSTGQNVVDAGKWTGEVAANVGQGVVDRGKQAGSGLAAATDKTKDNLSAGVGQVSQATVGAGKAVADTVDDTAEKILDSIKGIQNPFRRSKDEDEESDA